MTIQKVDHFENGFAVMDDGSIRECAVTREYFSVRPSRRDYVARLSPVLRENEVLLETFDGHMMIAR